MHSYETCAHRLDEISVLLENQQIQHSTLLERDHTIEQLEQRISQLQTLLFQERDHVLQLFVEVDRLKVREKDQKTKINNLHQQQSGIAEKKLLSKFHQNFAGGDAESRNIRTSAVLTANHQLPALGTVEYISSDESSWRIAESNYDRPALLDKYAEMKRQVESSSLTIKCLHQQLEEQACNARDMINALTEDQKSRIVKETGKSSQFHDREIITQKQLSDCQRLLLEIANENLQLRNQHLEEEKDWLRERDCLLKRCENSSCSRVSARSCQDKEVETDQLIINPNPEYTKADLFNLNETFDELNPNLNVSQRQPPCNRVNNSDEPQVNHYADGAFIAERCSKNAEQIINRLELTNHRYRNLERRRKLEVQGYKADISALRKKLTDVESKLLNVTLVSSKDPTSSAFQEEKVDVQILRNVRQTSLKSKMLAGELRNLKLVMYNLEDEIRNL